MYTNILYLFIFLRQNDVENGGHLLFYYVWFKSYENNWFSL